MASSPEYVTTASGYKVVYGAPEDFFDSDHCGPCALDGDAVLMEDGECPRCSSYRSYRRYECCEWCDREWAERHAPQEPEVSKQDYLVWTTLADLRDGLAQLTTELPALAEEQREDALAWQVAYEAEIARREALQAAGEPFDPEPEGEEPQRDLVADLLRARANYNSALMSGPEQPGYERMCANLEDEVQELARALQEELWDCDEERKLLARRGELSEEEQKEMDAMNAWAQKAFDALHPR